MALAKLEFLVRDTIDARDDLFCILGHVLRCWGCLSTNYQQTINKPYQQTPSDCVFTQFGVC